MPDKNRITPGSIDQLLDARLELRLEGFEPGYIIPKERIDKIFLDSSPDNLNQDDHSTVLKLFNDPRSVFKTNLDIEITFNLSGEEFALRYRAVENALRGLRERDNGLTRLLAGYLKDDYGHNAAGKLYHSVRVAVLSGLIAQLSTDIDLNLIVEGALLHDIGQLVAPAYSHRVRFKDGGGDKVTETSVKLLLKQYHPILGYLISNRLGASEKAQDIALDHHAPYYPQEYFTRDGEGPITVSLATQIVILVDRWDGLIKNRYYKRRKGSIESRTDESDGGSFDPNSAALYLAACTLEDRKRDELLEIAKSNRDIYPTINSLIKNERDRNGGSLQNLQIIGQGLPYNFLHTLQGMGFINKELAANYQTIRDKPSQ